MLLHQAVRGFQLWFGVRPEVTPELRALVETDLASDAEARLRTWLPIWLVEEALTE